MANSETEKSLFNIFSTNETTAESHEFNDTIGNEKVFSLDKTTDSVSNIFTNLFTFHQSTSVSSRPPSIEEILPSIVLENEMDLFQGRLHNNSKVISDLVEYSGMPLTPLTAPELDLISVDKTYNWTDDSGLLYLDSAHIDELAWLIPAVIVVIFIFFVIAYVCFYGVKTLELKIMTWCFQTCGCCRPGERQGSDGETDALTSNMALQQTEMKAYQSNSKWSRDWDDFTV